MFEQSECKVDVFGRRKVGFWLTKTRHRKQKSAIIASIANITSSSHHTTQSICFCVECSSVMNFLMTYCHLDLYHYPVSDSLESNLTSSICKCKQKFHEKNFGVPLVFPLNLLKFSLFHHIPTSIIKGKMMYRVFWLPKEHIGANISRYN